MVDWICNCKAWVHAVVIYEMDILLRIYAIRVSFSIALLPTSKMRFCDYYQDARYFCLV